MPTVETSDRYRLARRGKACLEPLLAALLLVAVAPLLILIGLAVAVSSPGPLVHRRRVVGLDGVEFDAFKFRTMVVGADALLRRQPALARDFDVNMKLRDDPRVTAIGALLRPLSLDELPQLLNVVRGEMSLVGPRIIAPEEQARFGDALARRLTVKPGITGLWQVSGRHELAYAERVRLDLAYIDHWTPWLDVSILLRTIPAVLSRRGAY
ncbi:MAG: sugar transferase [Deltaproteobacteria bacterium]|nr:sugar transferase [Deltaproteobacteria bacterium]